MTTEQSLIQAISDSRLVRERWQIALVYADWLDDQGRYQEATERRRAVEHAEKQINAMLDRSSFLAAALTYIESHPGCCKGDVVTGVYYSTNPNNGGIANRTKAYRYTALDKLMAAGLVVNRGNRSKYALYTK